MNASEQKKMERYQQLVKERASKPKVARDLLKAFIVGGSLGLVGEFLFRFFSSVEPTKVEATSATLAGLILVGALLTGLGVYDTLADWGGAGASVPITGFSNSIVSAAMDFRREGLILGMAAKMFVVAGPVLVYGALAGFLAGLIKVAVLGLIK